MVSLSRSPATNDTSRRSLKVGSRVTFTCGLSTVRGVVIEDRGKLDVGGEQVARVEFEFEGAGEPFYTEIPVPQVRLS